MEGLSWLYLKPSTTIPLSQLALKTFIPTNKHSLENISTNTNHNRQFLL